jgi:asparagine synthase (glutamine-hydrolysing)
MSMAHGLEVRSPLLDRRMVELAFRIPAERKLHWSYGKAPLRKLARRRLPGSLWQLPKRGFTAPVSEWIAGKSGALFREEVLRPDAAIAQYLDGTQLSRRYEAHRARRADHGYLLWAVWVLERWLQQGRESARGGGAFSNKVSNHLAAAGP